MIERTFEGGRLHSSLVAVKFYDDEDIITKYRSMERTCYALEKWRYQLWIQEWICCFLIAFYKLFIYIKKQQLHSYFSVLCNGLIGEHCHTTILQNLADFLYVRFQELRRYELFHRGDPIKVFYVKIRPRAFLKFYVNLRLAISYHINTQREVLVRGFKKFYKPTVWVNHASFIIGVSFCWLASLSSLCPAEAQKVWTFRMATFNAQKLSRRSA